MLLFNQSIGGSVVGRVNGAIILANATRPSTMMNRFATTSDYSKASSVPSGYNSPVLIAPPMVGGELVSTQFISGSSSVSANLLKGINLEADLEGIGVVTDAALTLITALSASLDGSGTLSANLTGSVSLAADLIGSGDLDAGLSLIANMAADLIGASSISAELKGIAHLAADIFVNQSEATVQQIVDAVWAAVTASNNTPGSMGEALGNAGGAANPWSELLADNELAGSFGEFIQTLLTRNGYIALK